MSNQFIAQYVTLAEASYADFSEKTFSDKDVEKAIVDTNENKKGSEKFAESVSSSFSVVAHWKDRENESSFSGTLFQNKETGKICAGD
ncbi:MAG: hypothetical protein Q4G42_03410 [Neisseria sp.]|nr:hypothetical protein [Neisseria sp.]